MMRTMCFVTVCALAVPSAHLPSRPRRATARRPTGSRSRHHVTPGPLTARGESPAPHRGRRGAPGSNAAAALKAPPRWPGATTENIGQYLRREQRRPPGMHRRRTAGLSPRAVNRSTRSECPERAGGLGGNMEYKSAGVDIDAGMRRSVASRPSRARPSHPASSPRLARSAGLFRLDRERYQETLSCRAPTASGRSSRSHS